MNSLERSKDRTADDESARRAPHDGLPHSLPEFRAALLRRLELLDQEVQGLDSAETHEMFLAARAGLESARRDLLERLPEAADPDRGWSEHRNEIISVWRRYRRQFEQLAAAWERRHEARPGQSVRGPRW